MRDTRTRACRLAYPLRCAPVKLGDTFVRGGSCGLGSDHLADVLKMTDDEHSCAAAGEEFREAAQLFLRHAAGYTQSDWKRRAESMRRLLQWLADSCADVRRQPDRNVPRLDNDFALADQFAVLSHAFDRALRAAGGGPFFAGAPLYRTATTQTRQLLAG